MCAWLITTASRSSRSKLNQSSRGYALSPEISPGLMPQSSITLLSGVTTIKHDLPTCLTPPRQNSITSSLLVDHDWGLADLGSLMAVVTAAFFCCCRLCMLLLFPFMFLTTSDPLNTRLTSFCRNSVLSFAELFSVECRMLMLDEGM